MGPDLSFIGNCYQKYKVQKLLICLRVLQWLSQVMDSLPEIALRWQLFFMHQRNGYVMALLPLQSTLLNKLKFLNGCLNSGKTGTFPITMSWYFGGIWVQYMRYVYGDRHTIEIILQWKRCIKEWREIKGQLLKCRRKKCTVHRENKKIK